MQYTLHGSTWHEVIEDKSSRAAYVTLRTTERPCQPQKKRWTTTQEVSSGFGPKDLTMFYGKLLWLLLLTHDKQQLNPLCSTNVCGSTSVASSLGHISTCELQTPKHPFRKETKIHLWTWAMRYWLVTVNMFELNMWNWAISVSSPI